MSSRKELDGIGIISSSINEFSGEFYKYLALGEKGNVICSPMSISMSLAMVTFGARGKTENQLRSCLRLPPDNALAMIGIESLIHNLNNFQQVKLSLANKLFIQKGFEMKSEFKIITETSFQSELEDIDFSDTEKASKTINCWCEEKTNNRIKDIVQPDTLQNARLVLVNAIYFKGEWVYPFMSNSTKSQPFFINQTVTKPVQMMFTDDSFNYGNLSDFNAQYIELPYKKKDENDATSLYIILPNNIKELEDIEANLCKINFSKIQGSPRRVLLYLPKFKIQSKLELKVILGKMGIDDAFGDAANFTGIVDQPPLKISKVFQKSFITVNEKGTEAGAVTCLKMVPMSLPPSFVVDKPFLCVLVAKSLGIPIFIGRVLDPTLDL